MSRIVALLATLLLPAASTGEEHWFHNQRLGVESGYAFGFGAVGSGGTPQEDIELVPLLLTWSVSSTPLLRDSWMKGRVELQLEGQLLFERRPLSGLGGGAAFDLRYNLLHWERVVSFIGGGLGMVGTDFRVRQSDGFNFVVQGGAGLHWRLGERLALTLQYRWHHISNADSRQPNNGVNTHMALIGPSWFLY